MFVTLETIENFFDLSYLIKQGSIQMTIDDSTGLPMISAGKMPTTDDYQQGLEKSQCLVTLTKADFEVSACPLIGNFLAWGYLNVSIRIQICISSNTTRVYDQHAAIDLCMRNTSIQSV